MDLYRTAKMFLSWCVCIQIMKIVKFTDELVPKMSLATNVLFRAREQPTTSAPFPATSPRI
jgi:hypothetical protein